MHTYKIHLLWLYFVYVHPSGSYEVAIASYLYKRNRVDNGGVHVKTHLEVMLYLRLYATHSSLLHKLFSVPLCKAIRMDAYNHVYVANNYNYIQVDIIISKNKALQI